MINLCHQSESSSTRDKNQIIQSISIRDFYELTERHPETTIQVLSLFRNLVDDNSLLVESKGDELLKVLKFWLNNQLTLTGTGSFIQLSFNVCSVLIEPGLLIKEGTFQSKVVSDER